MSTDRQAEPTRMWEPVQVLPPIKASEPSRFASLRDGWSARHTIGMIVVAPVAFYFYWAATPVASVPAWVVMIGAIALLAGLVAVSFLPIRGIGLNITFPNALLAPMLVPFAGSVLAVASSPVSGLVPLAMLGIAWWLTLGRMPAGASCGAM